MSWVPSLNISVAERQPTWVIDVDLALTPYGLPITMRLANEAPVWLLRSLWAALDQAKGERSRPRRPMAPSREPDEVIRLTWDEVRLVLAAGGPRNLYWAAADERDARLPTGTDPTVGKRVEALTAGLTGQFDELLEPDESASRGIEAVALCAALSDRRAAILSRLAPEATAPEPSRYLAAAGIKCPRIDSDPHLHRLRDSTEPTLQRSGVLELLPGAGLRLAVIHVVVPMALRLARVSELEQQGDDQYAWNGAELDPVELWQFATSYWYPIA
jgi:hypothetical protein